jgi:hypothetical protein
LLSWGILGWGRDITKGLIGVGAIMTVCSVYFFYQAPPGKDGDNGFLASEFDVVTRLQMEMVGKLDDIHVETQKIAANTEALVETTDDLRGYAISEMRFNKALENSNKKTVVMACKSGLRASKYIFFGGSSRNEPVDTYRDNAMVQLLIDKDCVPKEKVCRELFEEERMTGSMAQFAIHDRVKSICGSAALKKAKAVQADFDKYMAKPMFKPADLELDVDVLIPKTQ